MAYMSSSQSNYQLSERDLNILWNEYQQTLVRVMSQFRYPPLEECKIYDSFWNESAFNQYLNRYSDGLRFYIRELEAEIYNSIDQYLASICQPVATSPIQGYGRTGMHQPGTGSPVGRSSSMMSHNAFSQNVMRAHPSGGGSATDTPLTLADHLAKKTMEAQKNVPQVTQQYRIQQEPVISEEPYEIVQIEENRTELGKCTEVKEAYKSTDHVRIDMSVDYKYPKIVQFSSVNINTPCVSVIQAIRILKDQVPEMFDVPQKIIYVEYDQLHCEEIHGKESNIAESFKLLAEKATTINDIDTFMTIMVPALKNLSGKHGIINTKLKNTFNAYLMQYFRNPKQPTIYHQISNWVDVNTLITKTSSTMQPWTSVDQKYEALIWKFLYSSMRTVLQFTTPNGAHIPSDDMKNAGMFASIPKLQMSEGKHLLRDYGNMSPNTWKKMSAKIDQKYVLYKTKCKIFVTNLELDEIRGNTSAPLTIIPYSNNFSPMHIVSYAALEKSDPKQGQMLPLLTVVEYDDQNDQIIDTMSQGTLMGTGLIYF